MSIESLPFAALRAGLLGAQRLSETQTRFARDLWSLVAEPKRSHAWSAPHERRSDVFRNYAADLATDWSAAVSEFAQELQPLAPDGHKRRPRKIGDRTVLLPTRVLEASQGSAMWTVDPLAAQAALDAARLPFEPVLTGAGDALLSLFMVDYRVSDLDAYGELGAAIVGRPRGDALAPSGLVIFALPVSAEFSRDAGRQIWGYPKAYSPGLKVVRQGMRATCGMGPKDAPGLVFDVSRRGFGRSRDVAMVTYTMKDGRPTRVLFGRSGNHERMRFGGGVKLKLGGATPGVCECGLADAEPTSGCLCATLRALKLPGRDPITSGWTEIMSGSFGAPEPLPTSAAGVSDLAPETAPAPEPRSERTEAARETAVSRRRRSPRR